MSLSKSLSLPIRILPSFALWPLRLGLNWWRWAAPLVWAEWDVPCHRPQRRCVCSTCWVGGVGTEVWASFRYNFLGDNTVQINLRKSLNTFNSQGQPLKLVGLHYYIKNLNSFPPWATGVTGKINGIGLQRLPFFWKGSVIFNLSLLIDEACRKRGSSQFLLSHRQKKSC